jgi:hypothetical protein
MALRVVARIDGKLKQSLLADWDERVAAAVQAVDSAASDLRDELRDQVRSAGLGEGLANAWQLLPSGGRFASSALVYSKASRLHTAFNQSETITTQNADWLVIPLPAAVQRGLATDSGRNKDATSRSSNRRWSDVDTAISIFGQLRFVPLAGGQKALLIAPAVPIKRGTSSRGVAANAADIPLFLLLKQVHSKKLLDIEGAEADAQTRLETNLSNVLGGGEAQSND